MTSDNDTMKTNDSLAATVKELSDRLVTLQKPIRILDAVNWDAKVRQEFFRHKGKRQPNVTSEYYQHRKLDYNLETLQSEFLTLDRDISRQIGQLNPVGALMRRMCREFRLVLQMLEARGTEDFSALSTDLYGGPHDVFHAGEPSLAELGTMLETTLDQMTSNLLPEDKKEFNAEQAVEILRDKFKLSMPNVPVQVVLSDGIVSDAAAGSDTLKLNKDVMFSMRELDILEAHEGWIHLGTTFNGQSQPHLTFLAKGTPSATTTQEGLAVLTEIVTLRSTPSRLKKLVNRIRAVTLATEGATFLDIYRYLVDKGVDTGEAYTLASRAFRGSTPEGLPFTKDLSYVKGFVLIYNLIRVAIQLGRLDRIPILLCGKINIDDFKTYSQLMDDGTLIPPAFVPPHFSDFRGLAAWLSFGKFIGNLSFTQLEQDYRHLF